MYEVEKKKNPTLSKFYSKVLVEAAGSNATHDGEKMSVFTEKALDSGIVADGTIAQDISQMKSFWRVREAAPEVFSFADF